MIPIRDSIPCYCRPWITWFLIAVNSGIFLYLELMPEEVSQSFLYRYGLVSVRYAHPEWAELMGFGNDHFRSFFTSMFLHGGWMHVSMNMLFLWIFSDNIEDRMGRVRFVVFYLICGLVAAVCQYYSYPDSTNPMVGASGAIAGIMGAYFFLYPFARIILWIPLFLLPIFVEIPAIAFLGLWAIIQIYRGTTANLFDQESFSDVAWWGHIGGFIAGALIYRFFLLNKDMVVPEP